MTLREALKKARETLTAGGIESPSLESEILLRHVLKIDTIQLYVSLEYELSPALENEFRNLIERRLSGEPTPYITGHREFYGLDFNLTRDVLIPRPETELLVEMALKLAKGRQVIADIGTGCGAIAVALAVHLPEARIYATDISVPALEVARLNCRKHNVLDRVRLFQGDLLEPLPEPVDLIIANLPYVRKADLPDKGTLSFEPRLALDGGADGMEVLRSLCYQLNGRLCGGGTVLLEVGLGMAKEISELLRRLFPTATVEVNRDLGGIERVIKLTMSP